LFTLGPAALIALFLGGHVKIAPIAALQHFAAGQHFQAALGSAHLLLIGRVRFWACQTLKSPLDIWVSFSLPLAMAYGSALAVLADPTRRQVFERLRAGPRPVNVLAAGLPVSRPAVSQHLKALKDAGLVDERSEGVRRIYSLRREGLMELREWLDGFWTDALEAFRLEAEESHKTSRSE
jgi:DNA-binding transcriptional ArsR family regulator